VRHLLTQLLHGQSSQHHVQFILFVVHDDEMRLCLSTAATNGPIVHPPVGI
jgi:hypothetical protein